MANLLEAREWDYVVGSVHFLGDGARRPTTTTTSGTAAQSPERVWRRYFETLGEAARSGLFDILAHPDLVKVWGRARPRPDGDLRRYYELAMEAIAESGVAIEVSTAGLRKPVGEIYPAPRVPRDVPRRRHARSRCPATPTCPSTSATATTQALELLDGLGVDASSRVFERRERRLEPIG